MSKELESIFESPEITLIVSGMVFTEGPVWHPAGYLTFVDVLRSLLLRWTPGGDVEILRENTSNGNGGTLDLHGRLFMCEGGSRRVTRLEPDGSWTTVAAAWQGKRLNVPNDIICRSDGMVYFTDPALNLPKNERDIDHSTIWRLAPDGQLDIASPDLPYPNGLALSPDETVLYVANSRVDESCKSKPERGEICTHRYVEAFDVRPDGSLVNRRRFADMSSSEIGVPDGVKVDRAGRVFCNGSGGTWIFDSNGTRLGVLRTPEVPANCTFGGTDSRTLFLTARTSIYTVRVRTPGIGASR